MLGCGGGELGLLVGRGLRVEVSAVGFGREFPEGGREFPEGWALPELRLPLGLEIRGLEERGLEERGLEERGLEERGAEWRGEDWELEGFRKVREEEECSCPLCTGALNRPKCP